MPQADVKTFSWIRLYFAKDKDHLYCNDLIVDNISPDEYEIVNNRYIKDNHRVYYCGSRYDRSELAQNPLVLMTQADAGTFKVINENYVRDKSKVYLNNKVVPSLNPNQINTYGNYIWDQKSVYFGIRKLAKADTATLQPLPLTVAEGTYFAYGPDYSDNSYMRDKKYVYSHGSVLDKADSKSFERLTHMYTKDKRHVYRKDKIVAGVDAASFQVLQDNDYFKDKNHVYKNKINELEVIAFADPDTLKVTEIGGYASDKTNIFLHGELIVGGDGPSFEVLSYGPYAKDKRYVYYKGEIVVGANPMAIELIPIKFPYRENDLAKDDEHVYFKGKLITGSHAATFSIDNHGCVKDKNQVYHDFIPIKFADPETFVCPSLNRSSYSVDKSHVFYNYRLLSDADVKTFVLLNDGDGSNSGYAKDKNHIYFKGNVIVGADNATFKVTGRAKAKDKRNVYSGEKIIIP